VTEGSRPDGAADQAPEAGEEGQPRGAHAGPPGSRIFSLEGRPASGLYVVAWLLLALGLGSVFIGLFSSQRGASAALLIVGFLLLGASLLFAIGYQLVARAGRSAGAYRGPSPIIVFGALVFLQVVATAGLLLVGLPDPTGSSIGALLNITVTALLYVGAVWLTVVRPRALGWTEMGWPSRATGRGPGDLLADAAIGVATVAPIYLATLFAGGILAVLLGVHLNSPLPAPSAPIDTLATVLAAMVVAPIGEETFFRGFSLTAWRRDLGIRSALVRSTLFFAVVHILNVSAATAGEGVRLALLQFLVILPVGFLLGWLFVRRGIVASIAGHVTFNGIAILLLLAATHAGV